MKKYRILEIIKKRGDVIYVLQKRYFLFFWKDVNSYYDIDTAIEMKNILYFNEYQDKIISKKVLK
jgi:hypothetical protein